MYDLAMACTCKGVTTALAYLVTAAASSATTVFVMLPIFSISTVTTSPGFSQMGDGLRKQPTPGGVPVRMRSPGCSVAGQGGARVSVN